MAFRIETLSKWQIVVSFILFLAIVVLGFFIGIASPEVFKTTVANTASNITKGETADFVSPQLSHANQDVRFVATFYNSLNYMGIQQSLPFNVTAYRSATVSKGGPHFYTAMHKRVVDCELESKKGVCESVVLFHEGVINQPFYHILVNVPEDISKMAWVKGVRYAWVYVDGIFTTFEMAFRYSFCGLSVIALSIYIVAYCLFQRKRRSFQPEHRNTVSSASHEHFWTMVLLISLVLLDNPLFALNLSDYWFFPLINSVFSATFLAAMMLHLLVVFGGMINPTRTFLKFYLPRLLIVVPLWLLQIIGTVWADIHTQEDPTYQLHYEFPAFKFFQIAQIVLLIIYGLSYVFTIVRLFQVMRRVRGIARRFWAFFVVVHLTVAIWVAGQVLIAYLPGPERSGDYLALYALVNSYVWLIAFFFSPSDAPALYSFDQLTKEIEMEAGHMETLGSLATSGLKGDGPVAEPAPAVTHPYDTELGDDDDGDLASHRPPSVARQAPVATQPTPFPQNAAGINLEIDEATASDMGRV